MYDAFLSFSHEGVMSTVNTQGKRNNFLQELANAVSTGVKRDDRLTEGSVNGGDETNGLSKTAQKQAGTEENSPILKKSAAPRLVEIFVDQGIVSQEKIDEALEIQRKTQGKDKKRLIDILIEELSIDPDILFKTVARHYSFESVDPTPIYGNKERLQFIRQMLDTLPPMYYDLAVRLKIIPYELFINGYDKLIVITPDTTHPEVHGVARAFRFPKYEIKHVSVIQWNELWRQLAFDQGAKQLDMTAGQDFADGDRDEMEKEVERSLEDEIGRGKLNEVIEGLLIDGVRTGASDIHIIPKGTQRTEFHFRIDGRLSLWSAVTDVRSEAVITVVKDRAKNLDRFEKFLSQDGFAQRMIDNKMIRFRFSTMPIYSSDLRCKLESVVIRILRGADTITVESLGMPASSRDLFVKAIRKPQGIVIFTGPTGSGKSTSQFAALQTIMDPGINILTIEDPVEYLIEGCRQVKLNHKLDFEGALRGILRHDPDVVMVGEMRDKITAEIAVKLANTGHLIFSTLHTNDSVGAITRLYNMGIEPFLLAYTINIVIAQRLVRKLCDRCKIVDDHIDTDFLLDCGITEQEIHTSKFYKPVGCVHCIRGYRGRVGLFEALYITKEIRKIILKSRDFVDEDALRTNAFQNGMQTIRQSAINLLKEGVTSIENVEGMIIED
jgi:type IV pilus assembly protein PilB